MFEHFKHRRHSKLCDFPPQHRCIDKDSVVLKGLGDLSLLLFILRTASQHLTDLQAYKHRLKPRGEAKTCNKKHKKEKEVHRRISMLKLNGKWFQIHCGWVVSYSGGNDRMLGNSFIIIHGLVGEKGNVFKKGRHS